MPHCGTLECGVLCGFSLHVFCMNLVKVESVPSE